MLYRWKFLLNSVQSNWLLQDHMTSNNETVSRQNLWAGNTAKNLWCQRVTFHCYLRRLTDDLCYSKVRWMSSFKISNYITNHLKTGPLGNSKFCLPRDQSLSVYYLSLGCIKIHKNDSPLDTYLLKFFSWSQNLSP